MRKTNMDMHHQLCKQTKRRRTTEWELSNWTWANQYLEVVRVTQMMHCPWLEIFLHIFVVMIFCIDGRWTFYINKFTFFISIHFCQGFFFANLSNFECSLGGSKMFVQDVKCLFRNISDQWTPFLWGGITFMFFHQSRQFKWLWMPLEVKHKFSLDPIGKQMTPSV
jgi:hypothetical protein